MKKMYQEFLAGVDKDFLRENAIKLMTIEQKQTSAAHYKACEFVRDLMIENGIPNVELLEFPADGKTVYQDKRMPIAWDASVGKLTIMGNAPSWTPYWGDGSGGEGVLADYQRHPFHLIHGSVSTPPEGIITRIITEDQYLAGTDPRGCLVMLNPMTDPRPRVLKPILDQGGLGVVSDYLVGRYSTPDHLQWVVACTETGDWHVTAEDRPFIGFSVSPKVGDMIRKSNGCNVKVECDGRRYEGVLPMVTALIPGKSEKEVWVMAHMFEPMLNDDAIGVITGIEVAKQLLKKGVTPDYSIRLVFAMELYGFAAYAAYRGGNLNGKVVGACNLDNICCVTGDIDLKLSPSGCDPSLCNVILKEMYDEFKDVRRLQYATKEYHDDQHLSDRSVGVPTTWFMGGRSGGLWHNSRQCEPDFINWDLLHDNAAFACVYFDRMANSSGVVVPEQKLELKDLHSKWRDYAANFVFARKEPGFPNSQVKVPPYARIPLPDSVIYGHFGNVLSNMDGKKNVATLILEAEAERGFDLKEGQVKKVLNALNHLADYGYLDVIERPALTQEDLVAALKQAGITQDDVLLVHASISKCGYIQGGAETVINAIREASDTCLFTTFTRPYIYLGGVNGGWNYQPHDPAKPDQVWTGIIGKTVLRNYPDAIRSRHVTHSWAGFGSKAHECLDAHAPCDTPTGKNSPLEKALELNGKILFFGTGLEPSTFLHYLEDIADVPYLDTAICRVKTETGDLKTVAIEKHLPGDREFYWEPAENSVFYRKAFERGLKVKKVPLGMSFVQVIDLQELYRIGMELVKEDPLIFLCEKPDCLFCSSFRK